MASRPEANGRSSGRSLGARKGVVPGASGLLGMMTRHITVDERPAEAVDEADAPDVVLFDPEEYPDLPESSKPYVRVLVDKFIAAKLRPHQVVGVSARAWLLWQQGNFWWFGPPACLHGRIGNLVVVPC